MAVGQTKLLVVHMISGDFTMFYTRYADLALEALHLCFFCITFSELKILLRQMELITSNRNTSCVLQ